MPIRPFLNGVLPETAPGEATGWATENAFPNLSFVDPIWLLEVPGTTQLLLVGKNGQLWRFENRRTVTQGEVRLVLDWSARTQTSGDQGFYQVAFHPEFGRIGSPNRRYLFACYNHRPPLPGAGPNNSYWRVSRFTWNPATGTIDRGSELVLISQFDPQAWHNGGAMCFDQAGYLYITCGDGGLNYWWSNTQVIDQGFFSGVFRIDVDNDSARSHPIRRQPLEVAILPADWPGSFSQGYGIPNDNPWQDPGGGVLEEFYALGFRSPHTMHLDAATGELWVGDVGELTREELTRVYRGSNCQWSYREGLAVGPLPLPANLIGIDRKPEYDYDRGVGQCIIGGMRYRGALHRELLGGKVLFGDHMQGKIWALAFDRGVGAPTVQYLTGFTTGDKAGLGNFCTDLAGEVYLMNLSGTDQPGGTIHRLVPATVVPEPPPLLSLTGIFTNLATLATAPGIIPYEVNSALWSDAAEKKRWIALPNNGGLRGADQQIAFSESGNWRFPVGTVFIKHFELPVDERNPAITRRLETRLLVCTEGGSKYGVTYKWNEQQTDAALISLGQTIGIPVTLADGSASMQSWDFPSRHDCLQCHSAVAGQALGVRTHQLNRELRYPATGRVASQLETWTALGMFDQTLTVDQLAVLPRARAVADPTAPLEHRVRSYLDSNCAHCHQPGAIVDGFDARLTTPLNQQNLVNGSIQGFFDLGPNGRYLKPGDLTLSALHVRMNSVTSQDIGIAMPPLAKRRIDSEAVQALGDYIRSLTDSEFQTTASPTARYVKLIAESEVGGQPWASIAELQILDGNGATIPRADFVLRETDSEETVGGFSPAALAIDGKVDTFWHSQWFGFSPPLPHFITLDLRSSRPVGGFIYTPRQDFSNGRIANWSFWLSEDGLSWTKLGAGTWPDSGAVQRWAGAVGERAARCSIAGPSGEVEGEFTVTAVFDMKVSGFDASDFAVTGGQVVEVRGSGHYYEATVQPRASEVTVRVLAGAVNTGIPSRAAAQTVSVGWHDDSPPSLAFAGLPDGSPVAGTFSLGVHFNENIQGFTSEDVLVSNGSVLALTGSGANYQLTIEPRSEGPVGIKIAADAIVDIADNPMGESAATTLVYRVPVLTLEAEAGALSGAMTRLLDTSASNLAYIRLRNSADPSNAQSVNPNDSAQYQFVLPRSGEWLVRGLVRSVDASRDSFWVEFDGNQGAGTIFLWDVDPASTGRYVWDFLNHRNNALGRRGQDPVMANLSAGAHSVTVYGRDFGVRLDRIEMVSVRPLVTLSGPSGRVDGPFVVDVKFSQPVTGLEARDFAVTGATAAHLGGSGASYRLTLNPTRSAVIVTLPGNSAANADAAGNHESNPVGVKVLTHFDQWLMREGITDGGPSFDRDRDQVVALVEFAFNLDPVRPDRTIYDPNAQLGSHGPEGLPRGEVIEEPGRGRKLRLTFLQRRGESGLTYTAEFSSNLTIWSSFMVAPEVRIIDADWQAVTVEETLPTDVLSQRFVRVRIGLAP